LAAACFVKAFGVAFLGRPRTAIANSAEEVDGFSRAAMFAFAALCLIAGVLPGFVIDGLAPVTQTSFGQQNARASDRRLVDRHTDCRKP
jgi:putative copper export protein